jgi:hypothetical protein
MKSKFKVQDTETIKMFTSEVSALRKEIQKYIDQAQDKKLNHDGYQTLGLKMEGVSGTAIMLGYEKLAAFTRSLKEMSYMASYTDNEAGKVKVYNILSTSVNTLDLLVKSINDPSMMASLSPQINLVTKKVETLQRSHFQGVKDMKGAKVT